MKLTVAVVLIWFILLNSILVPPAQAFVYGNDLYTPADYYNYQPPAAGGAFLDPTFGTVVKRVTDATHTQNMASGGMLTFIQNEYSTMNPFNIDNTYLLLLHQSYFALYDGLGNFRANLPLEVNSLSEPRWSRTDPNVFYYHVGNQLKQYDVRSGADAVVHTFSEYSRIEGKGESDISIDGRHFVFAGDNRYVFTYDIATGRTSPVFDTAGHAFDSLQITPYNNVIISWLESGSGRYQGIELFDVNLRFYRQLARAGGHMDVTREMDGREVMVWFNAADPAPICENGIVKVELASGEQSCLLQLDWSLAGHVSATDAGWVLIETYAPSDPGPENWLPFTNEILLLRLDGFVQRLVDHRSRPFNSYNYQPHAAISHDARRFVYSSNFGLQALLHYPREYADVYIGFIW